MQCWKVYLEGLNEEKDNNINSEKLNHFRFTNDFRKGDFKSSIRSQNMQNDLYIQKFKKKDEIKMHR